MRIKRIAAVTAGLMLAGGVFGAIVSVTVLIGWGLAFGLGPRGMERVLVVGLAGGCGLGAVLGPIAAWLLMRHVPLGLAVGGTTFGTLVGGGLALLGTGDPAAALLFGLTGFVVTAIGLRFYVPRGKRLRSVS